MHTNNKIHKNFCAMQLKFTQIWIKFGDPMCQLCVCYSNIHNLYMYKHKTIRNQLIGYLHLYRLNEIWKQPID